MAKRTYTSAVRTNAARETRAAILRASQELFLERGYTRATLSAIAERAGVALNTLYTSVGGKPALVAALAQEATEDTAIAETIAAVQASDDGWEILRLTAESTGRITRRHEKVLNLLYENAAVDPAVAAVAEQAAARYRERLTLIADRLVALRAVGTDTVLTEQILWFYLGQGAWRTVRDFGWDWSDSAAWLARQAAAALLLPTADPDSSTGPEVRPRAL